MDRRSFISLLSSGVITLPFGARIWRDETQIDEPGEVRTTVKNLLPHLDGGNLLQQEAEMLGTQYLQAHPGAAAPEDISALLSQPRQEIDTPEQSSLETVASLLNAEIRADFEQGRTVRLQGWVLSQTEAQLCALTVRS